MIIDFRDAGFNRINLLPSSPQTMVGAMDAAHVKITAVAGTTRFITRCLLIASLEPRLAMLCPPGGGEGWRQLLVAMDEGRFVCAAGHRWFRSAFQVVVDFLLPGIITHYLARKRCLEDWCRDGVQRQVVVLGAGLDTLAWRRCRERPEVRFIEIDRPAASRIKTRALGPDVPPNLTFLAADLVYESPMEVLRAERAFDPSAPTLFILEGLSMYLPPARVQVLLAELAASGGPRVLALTFMEARRDGRIKFRRSNPIVDWWLRWQGEPFTWSLAPEEAAAFLARTGWQARELVSADTLRSRYVTPAGLCKAPLAAGEWLTLADNLSIR